MIGRLTAHVGMASVVALALCAGTARGQDGPQAEPSGTHQQAPGHGSHAGQHAKPPSKPKGTATTPDPHAGHQAPAGVPKEPIPPVTDADRAAAFPDVEGHTVHDRAWHYFVVFDQLEWQPAEGRTGVSWDNRGWIGGDLTRFWFRTEGEGGHGRLESAHAHALFGRAIAPWWDVVVGVRRDVRPGPGQTWAAIGIQGLAPYFFEVEATAYVGASARTHLRLETEYELLLTNRLVLQPLVEIEIHGKSDPERGVGAGLSTIETGLRARYEVRREFAPYIGLLWSRKFFGTADLARAAGESTGGPQLALGARLWF